MVEKNYFNNKDAEMIYSWYKLKKNYADKHKNKKKIIIVSGSNAMFGLNSKLLEKKLNLPVINYATHGGLKNYIFIPPKEIIQKNDIVLMPLEYTYYAGDKTVDSISSKEEIEYYISKDFINYKKLSTKERLKIFNYWIRHISDFPTKNRKTDFKICDKQNVYSYCSFNIYGNTTLNKETIENLEFYDEKFIFNLPTEESILKNKKLFEFIDYCKDKKATVIMTYPAMYKHKNIDKKQLDNLREIKKIFIKLGINFIGNPEDFLFDKKYMHNTSYHLNLKGAEKNTYNIIKELKLNYPEQFQN